MQHVTSLAHKAGYKPGKTIPEYENPKLHHVGRMPTFETRERVIRELGPVDRRLRPNFEQVRRRFGPILRQIVGARRRVISRTVTKVIMSADGKTPRSPVHVLQQNPKTGKLEHILQTTLYPVPYPALLKRGTSKMLYRDLKRHNATLRTPHLYKGR